MFGLRRNRPNPAQVAETHRDNLRKLLEHRLEVARAKGDKELIRHLEAEADSLK
jgi:hypothetical protein